jgi:hypothetical protein
MSILPNPDTESLKDFARWHRDGNFSLWGYATANLTPDLLIAVSKLFWPDFILYEDCILWAHRFSKENFLAWKAKLHDDLSAVEKLYNHEHLGEGLLQHLPEPLSDQNILYLKDTLVQIWGAALRSNFPDRKIEIEAEFQEDSGDYVITFWQTRENTS